MRGGRAGRAVVGRCPAATLKPLWALQMGGNQRLSKSAPGGQWGVSEQTEACKQTGSRTRRAVHLHGPRAWLVVDPHVLAVYEGL